MVKNKQNEKALPKDYLPPIDWKKQRTNDRAHTQDEMELAFRRLRAAKEHLDLLPDDDDPLAVFGDVIAELLEKRQIVADEISYKQQWLATHARR